MHYIHVLIGADNEESLVLAFCLAFALIEVISSPRLIKGCSFVAGPVHTRIRKPGLR